MSGVTEAEAAAVPADRAAPRADAPQTPAVAPLDARGRRAVLASVVLAVLLAAMDQTIVGTALPRIAGELGRLDLYAWVFTSYLVAVAIVAPIAGQIGDRHGRRVVLLAGLAVFVAGSLLAGLAPSMPALVLARAVQGLGAGALTAGAHAVLGDLYPPSELGRYNGLLSGVYGIASVIGPLAGGLITDAASWRWAFLINVPLCALAFLPLARHAPRRGRPSAGGRLDLAGVALLASTLVPGLLALSWIGGGRSLADPPVLAMAGLGLLSAVGLCVVEARVAAPILPVRLLRGIVGLGGAIAFLAAVSLYACSIYLPLLLQVVHGLGATRAGLVMTPLVLALVLASVLGGLRVTRSGRYRPTVLAGLLAMVVSLALLLLGGLDSPAFMAAALAVFGFGVGLSLPALTLAAQNAVSHAELGVATSLPQLARSLGGIISVAALGALLERSLVAGELGQAGGLQGLRGFAEPAVATPEALLLRAAIHDGVVTIVWGAAAVAVLALLCGLALREIPLRRTIDPDDRP